MNGAAKVKELNWPRRLYFPFHSDLLGPCNSLGRLRWYYDCHCYFGKTYFLQCYRVDSRFRKVAVGLLLHSCASSADFKSQESRLIAKCIRGALPV